MIIILTSLFKEDNIFSERINLTYGPHKSRLNELRYLQIKNIYNQTWHYLHWIYNFQKYHFGLKWARVP